MAINAEQLNIRLTAETKDLRQELTKAEKRIKGFEARARKDLRSTTSSFDMLAASAKRFAPAIAAAVSVQTLQNTMEFAQNLENLSRISGTNVENFQAMAFAAQKYGVQQDKLADILKDTNDKLGDFFQTGAGPMADFFENIAPKVGVTADQFRKLSGPDALQLYVDSLQKAGVSQSEMTFYMEALASDAALLTPLLANNGEEMARLGEKARSLGIVLDEDLIRQTAQMNEVWATVMTAMSTNFTAFAAHVITGFDNIFGITRQGQLNRISVGMEELRQRAAGLQSALTEVGDTASDTDSIAVDEFTGLYGQVATNVGDARAELEEVNYQLEVQRAQYEEILALDERMRKAREDIANTPSIGTTEGAGSSAKSLDQTKQAWENLLASLSETKKAAIDYARAEQTINEAVSAGIATKEQAAAALGLIKMRYDQATGAAIDFTSVGQTMQSSMENAFMSILDGTASAEDAFKQMAAQIIKELYRVLVVQRLVGQFQQGGGGIMGAIFNAFGGGARAAGGTVQAGSPTITGEHGRELFVPQVNGRVMTTAQTKQMMNGGGGGVTVIQNNTFGQGVSRAEINAMMPRIVETTKAAVLDAKRRGGSYGRAMS
jgi:hypothetical protein